MKGTQKASKAFLDIPENTNVVTIGWGRGVEACYLVMHSAQTHRSRGIFLKHRRLKLSSESSETYFPVNQISAILTISI